MVSEMDAKTKDKIAKTDAEWRARLTPEQYKVTREGHRARLHRQVLGLP